MTYRDLLPISSFPSFPHDWLSEHPQASTLITFSVSHSLMILFYFLFLFIYYFFFDDPILNWKPPLHPSPHHDPTRLIITIIQHTTQSFVYSLSPTSRTQASWLQNFLSDFVWFTTVTPTPMAHSRHSVSNCWMTEYLLPFHLNFLLLWLSPFTHFVHIS